MKTAKPNGSSSGAMSSTISDARSAPLVLPVSLLLCLAGGLAIVLLDSFVRIPLHAPGWRGLVIVPVLMLANRSSTRPWGASATALAAAGFSLWLGDPMRMGPLAYLLPGLIADAGLALIGQGRLAQAASGALVNLASLATGVLSGAMLAPHGGPGPMAWAGHVLFGALGGLAAALIERARHR